MVGSVWAATLEKRVTRWHGGVCVCVGGGGAQAGPASPGTVNSTTTARFTCDRNLQLLTWWLTVVQWHSNPCTTPVPPEVSSSKLVWWWCVQGGGPCFLVECSDPRGRHPKHVRITTLTAFAGARRVSSSPRRSPEYQIPANAPTCKRKTSRNRDARRGWLVGLAYRPKSKSGWPSGAAS